MNFIFPEDAVHLRRSPIMRLKSSRTSKTHRRLPYPIFNIGVFDKIFIEWSVKLRVLILLS